MSILKTNAMKLLSICIIFSLILTCIISVLPLSLDSCNCENYIETHNSIYNDVQNRKYYNSLVGKFNNKKKLAIIIPFRDRFDELLEFAPYMTKFLNDQEIPHHIFVINQVDRFRFNRASLINVGFLYTKDNFDYFAMHDVDLLPLNNDLKYEYPENDGVMHIAAPGLHPKYNYPSFIGGILIIKNEHFAKVNGMSNRYWGWGLEDDEFYVRLKDASIKVYRPQNIKTDMSNTFVHNHDRIHRRRDTAKCYNQKEETRKRDKKTGLDTLKYNINSRKELAIDGIKLTILNVKFECDKSLTPWCECSGDMPTKDTKSKAKKGL